MKGDLSNLMKQAQQMQENIKKAQEEMANTKFTGTAGAGLVYVTLTGRYDCTSVSIDDSLLKEKKDLIEDLLAAAFNAAVKEIESKSRGQMSSLMGGMNLPSGFNFP